MNVVQQNCNVFGEMLTEQTPGQEQADDWSLMQVTCCLSVSPVQTVQFKKVIKSTRMALDGAHTSAKATDLTKLLLLNKRQVIPAEYGGALAT